MRLGKFLLTALNKHLRAHVVFPAWKSLPGGSAIGGNLTVNLVFVETDRPSYLELADVYRIDYFPCTYNYMVAITLGQTQFPCSSSHCGDPFGFLKNRNHQLTEDDN